MTKLLTVRKTKLPAREIEICARLRRAREEFLQLTQAACAKELGIDRSTLANYEAARTPLKYDLGLRFCYQFIISEEWLATGQFAAIEAQAVKEGVGKVQGDKSLETIYQRQSMALITEAVCRQIPPGELFSAAYQEYFAPIYGNLIKTFFHVPRVVLSETDSPERNAHIVMAYFERWMKMVSQLAFPAKKNQRQLQNEFTSKWLSLGGQLFGSLVQDSMPATKRSKEKAVLN